MSDVKLEVTEPDPSATTIQNDETVNTNGSDPSAPTDVSAETAKSDGVNTEQLKADQEASPAVKSSSEAITSEDTPKEDVKAEAGDVAVKKDNSSTSDRHRGGNNRVNGNAYRGRDVYPRRKNNKFDPSSQDVTDDPTKIRAQVEFYFGDANLPTDKFLWEQTDGPENKPVPVATIHKFKRMQVFQPYSAVVEALKESSFLVLEGEEGKETIKRRQAYSPSHADQRLPRTIYAKGFGEEKPTTQLDLENWFAQFGKTRAVRLRRHLDGPDSGLFKESVFVEFDDEETAKKFLETDPKPQYEGKDLKIMSKQAYVEEKNQLIKDGKMQPNTSTVRKYDGNRGGRGRGRGRGGRDDRRGNNRSRDDRDPDDWKKRRENDQKSGFRNDRRGGQRGGRGGRNGDRDNKDEKPEKAVDVAAVAIAEEEASKKRARDEEGDASEVPAKRQDTKQEPEAKQEVETS